MGIEKKPRQLLRVTLAETSSLQASLTMEKVDSRLACQTVHKGLQWEAQGNQSLGPPEWFRRWGLGLQARSGSGILD